VKQRVAAAEGCIPKLVALVSSARDEDVVASAACALQNVVEDMEDIQNAVAAVPGCVPSLVARLGCGNAIQVREEAAEALGALADNNSATQAMIIATPGCLTGLVACLTTRGRGTDALKTSAMQGLMGLVVNSPNNRAVVAEEPGCLSALVDMLRSQATASDEAVEVRLMATIAADLLGELATDSSDEQKSAIAAVDGCLQALVQLLQPQCFASERQTAALALSDLATGCAHNRTAIAAEEGAIPSLVALLRCRSEPDVQEAAAAALGSLAEDCPDNQTKIAQVCATLSAQMQIIDNVRKASPIGGGCLLRRCVRTWSDR
jgi:hypothetical protein